MSKPLLDVVTTSNEGDPTNPSRPRSTRPPKSYSSVRGRIRVIHACDRCRVLKAKCSGGVRCVKCTKDDTACQYSDRRREMIKKLDGQISDLRRERTMLIAALEEVISSSNFQPKEHLNVVKLLTKVGVVHDDRVSNNDLTTCLSSATTTEIQNTDQSTSITSSERSQSQDTVGGESVVPPTVGSPGHSQQLSYLTNLTSGAGMAGYVGKMSDMSWLLRVREYLFSEVTTAHAHDHPVQALELTYFMDDRDLLSVDEDYIDQFQLPSLPTAMILTEAYFHALQGAFHFVDREVFLPQLIEIISGRRPVWENCRFLSVANILLAVGAKWLELAQLDQQNIIEDHQVYYARARALGLDHRIQIDHPDIEMLQGLSILAFYLLVNGSIQRAWAIHGQANRHAIALGLHVNVPPRVISASERRKRATVCYSMYRLEILISEMTGRPNYLQAKNIQLPVDILLEWNRESETELNRAIVHTDILTDARRLWMAFLQAALNPVDLSNSRLFPSDTFGLLGSELVKGQFMFGLELSRIRDTIGTRLYLSPTDMTWADVQRTITELETELEEWQSSLGPELSMESVKEINPDSRAQLELEMYHCSVKMILYRPALCEIHIPNESLQSRQFNHLTARACVQAAMRMLDLMPHKPVASMVVQVVPWWSILHYVCQATAVLLLELCLNVQHVEEGAREIAAATRKAVHYLWWLSPSSKSAYKAWSILGVLVDKVMERLGSSGLVDGPTDTPWPGDWNKDDETMLLGAMSALQ